MKIFSVAKNCALLILGCMIWGCGSKSEKKQSVQGTVWYRGMPLPGGVIIFVPDEARGNSGPLCRSSIAADGNFHLAQEVPSGWYRIAIAPLPTEAESLPSVSVPYPGPARRYRNPELSGLTGEIRNSAENHFEFVLDDS